MSIYDTYEVDPSAEADGVWIDSISDPEKFKIAAFDNENFQKALTKMYEPHKAELRRAQKIVEKGGNMPKGIEKILAGIDLKCACNHILVNWEKVKDRKGKNIEYSPDAAYKLLSEKGMHRLKEAILEESHNLSNFSKEMNKESEKNLKTVSTTS